MPIDQAIEHEIGLFGACFASEDQKEGMKAFLEKRKEKVFKNR
jgi:enoyl-CoA hydratase